MAVTVDVVASAISASAATLTTGSVSPGGSDRYVLAVSGATGGDADAVKYGGSGGTDLGVEYGPTGVTFGIGSMTAWGLAPGPSGSTTFYADFLSALADVLAAICLNGVDQTTPHTGAQLGPTDGFTFGTSQGFSHTVTTEDGQKVVGLFVVEDAGDKQILDIVAGADTVVEVKSLADNTGTQRVSAAIVSGDATGSTHTLNVTVTFSGESGFAGGQYISFAMNEATGGAGISGELDQALGALTSSATGVLALTGTLNATLGDMLASGAGTNENHGELASTLGAMTLAATGTMGVAGNLDATLGAMTVAATGALALTGTLAQTLGEMLASGAGTNENHGTLAATLGALTLTATGTGGGLGELTATLGEMTLAATAEVSGVPLQTLGGGGITARGQSGLASADIAEQERRNREALRARAERLAEEARQQAEAEAQRQAEREARLQGPRGARVRSPVLQQLMQRQVREGQERVANYQRLADESEALARQAETMRAEQLRRLVDELACMLLLQAVL